MTKAKDNPTNCTPTGKSDPVKEMNELYNTNSVGDKTGYDGKVGGVKSSESGNPTGPYANLKDSKYVGEGKKFTSSQKKNIIKQNMEKNGGVIKSDLSGKILVPATKSQKGVTPDPLEVHIDHIFARSKGGTNSYSNAQVLSRIENILKSDK